MTTDTDRLQLAGLIHGALASATDDQLARLAGEPDARLSIAQWFLATVANTDRPHGFPLRHAYLSGLTVGGAEALTGSGVEPDTAFAMGLQAAEQWNARGDDLPPADELADSAPDAVAAYIGNLAAAAMLSADCRTVH